MVQVNLYSEDGRVLATVCVWLPMPQVVSWGGNTYLWSRLRQRYERFDPPVALKDAPAGLTLPTGTPGATEPEEF